MITLFQVGQPFLSTGKLIKDVRWLANGWILVKTENGKSSGDFKVRTVYSLQPVRHYTPKHAHFAIDLYGKWCSNSRSTRSVFDAIADLWQGQSVAVLMTRHAGQVGGLPGYDLEYILSALEWILEQEDINFTGRPPAKQAQLDGKLAAAGIQTPPGRLGSQLAMVLLLEVSQGRHPVEALLAANLDVQPLFRRR